MNKKILIITEYFYPEEFKINEIALEWQKKGYIVDILTQTPTYPFGKIYDGYKNRWFYKEKYNGLDIYRVKAVTGYKESLFKKLLKYFTFMMLGSFVSLRIGKKYDYIFGFDIASLSGMIPAILLNKLYKKPVTLWVQDVWPDSVYAYGFKKNPILELILNGFVKFIYANTTNFAVSGEGFAKRIKPFLKKDKKIKYLPNWADELDKNLKPFAFSKEKRVHFTFAGNIGKMQNLDNIIKAFGTLEKNYTSKAQLNIIGDGSFLEELKELVKNNGFRNIIFWGKKPRNEINKYLQGSDFLIVSLIDKPIFNITVPAKLQTYIASQKPILAILKGDASKIVKDNNLGFCANPNDLSQIQNIFKNSIDCDKIKKKKFSKNCEILTNTIFNKEKTIDSLLQLLLQGKK